MARSDSGRDPALIELESKLAFLERTVEEMSRVMGEQGTEILQLQRTLQRLASKLEQAAEESDDGPPHHDPPPHY